MTTGPAGMVSQTVWAGNCALVTSMQFSRGPLLVALTVTNASNYALARALDIPHVADEVRPVLGLTRATEVPPLTGNGPGGATVGLLQFDVIDNDDPATEATHDNMPTSDVGRELIESFLASHFEDGAATLSDPYVQLGLSHAPPTP